MGDDGHIIPWSEPRPRWGLTILTDARLHTVGHCRQPMLSLRQYVMIAYINWQCGQGNRVKAILKHYRKDSSHEKEIMLFNIRYGEA